MIFFPPFWFVLHTRPYNLERSPSYDRYNTFPHLAYLELSRHFIAWYKLPAGSPPPRVRPADERLFYFYNLQVREHVHGPLRLCEIPTRS